MRRCRHDTAHSARLSGTSRRRPSGRATSRARRSGCVKRLTPQRGLTAAVILLGVAGIAIGVIGPRILGHATDLLFNGVIGRQLPAGLTKEQAIAAARARGDNTFADLLSGMNVVPGRGRGLRRGRPHPAAGAWPVSGCRAADLGAGPTAQRHRAADHGGAAVGRRGQSAPASAVVLRLPAARRGAQPGHQRRRQHPDVAVDDDQPAADLDADRGGGAGDDADDLAAADADHGGDGAAVAVGDPGDRPALAAAVRRAVANTGGSTRTSRRPTAASPSSRPSATGPRAEEQFRELQRRRLSTPASARSSSPAWSRRRRRSSATSATSAVAVVGGLQVATGPDHARQHPGVHPVRPPVQPAADPGRRDVQHAAVRGGQCGAGVRPARRRGAAARTRRRPAVPRRTVRAAGSSSSTSTSATGPAPRSSRTCRWSPSRAAPSRSSARPARARPRW